VGHAWLTASLLIPKLRQTTISDFAHPAGWEVAEAVPAKPRRTLCQRYTGRLGQAGLGWADGHGLSGPHKRLSLLFIRQDHGTLKSECGHDNDEHHGRDDGHGHDEHDG
jgi:hypothetical protein